MNVARRPSGTCVVGAAVARRCRCAGTKAAEHESQNENPARRLGRRIGSRPFRKFLERDGSRLHGGVRNPPMLTHRDDPFIGYLMRRVCKLS
jgi:hypothetical protein